METRIAIASVNLAIGFGGVMCAQLRKLVQPGQRILEFQAQHPFSEALRELTHRRLLAVLDARPRPLALIGICIRPEPDVLRAFRQARVPVVLIDEEAEGASTVATDNRRGGQLAGEHLVAAGRRSLAVVSGPLSPGAAFVSRDRVDGMRQAVAAQGLHVAPGNVIEVIDYSRKDGVRVMSQLLDEGRQIDGIFCAAGDACAAGMLAVAAERGVKVPEQIAIVGFDDNPLAGISHPPLTTVRQPLAQMAEEAWRLATSPTAEMLARPQRVLVEPTLVVRKSA